VMPQTREHLAIIELLGISRGVVALTKSDAADAEWLELVREDAAALLAGSSLASAPLVPVSARTGAGLQQLAGALAAAAAPVPPRAPDDLFRMPIDRVFTVKGTGTVVTGTVWSGTLRRDDAVRIEPAGAQARIRMLQRHGTATAEVGAGERAAVALTGFDRHALRRGDVLLTDGSWRAASMLTVELTVLPDSAAALQPRQRVRLHLGTAEVLGRLALPGGELAPGRSGLAQLRLEAPVVARAGDRFVLRSYSPVHTVAGGVVLEPDAPKRKRFDAATARDLQRLGAAPAADDRVRALLSLAGPAGARRADLPLLTGLRPAQAERLLDAMADVTRVEDRVVHGSHVAGCRAAIVGVLEAFHGERPIEEGMDRDALRRATGAPPALFEAALQQLLRDGTLASRGGEFGLAGHEPVAPPAQAALLERVSRVFEAAGLQAPDLAELPADLGGSDALLPLLRFLERQRRLVRISPTRWADAAATMEAAARLRQQLPTEQELPLSELKLTLGLSRKHLIPLLEYFDRTGVCVRRGEARIVTAPVHGDSSPASPTTAVTED
jgi:selenocysteine-specific elongation factor